MKSSGSHKITAVRLVETHNLILPDNYKVIRQIGVGAMGNVYEVEHKELGVLLLQIIFVGLNFLSVDQNLLYIIKGGIILLACAIDMRKYLVRK